MPFREDYVETYFSDRKCEKESYSILRQYSSIYFVNNSSVNNCIEVSVRNFSCIKTAESEWIKVKNLDALGDKYVNCTKYFNPKKYIDLLYSFVYSKYIVLLLAL